jgi:hypothetical protein
MNFLKFLRRERKKLSAKNFFAKSQLDSSRRRNPSPRVLFFAENIIFYSRQRGLRREHEIKLSPKNIALAEASVSVVMYEKTDD